MHGLGCGMDALGSPICAAMMLPPLMMQSASPEESRRPEHEVGKLALFHRADVLRDTVRDCRVDGVFGDVALGAHIVVVAFLLRKAPALLLHLVRGLPGADDHFADPPMAWLSDDIIESAPISCRMSSAAMVFFLMRLSANAKSSAIDGSR